MHIELILNWKFKLQNPNQLIFSDISYPDPSGVVLIVEKELPSTDIFSYFVDKRVVSDC